MFLLQNIKYYVYGALRGLIEVELDTIEIGARIRKIREEDFKESREVFAERCNITENHLGRLERGQFLITTNLLNKISIITGVDTDYILHGKKKSKELSTRRKIDKFLDVATKEELKMYYGIISTIKGYYKI